MREKKRGTRRGDAEGRVYIDTAMHSLGAKDTHCGGSGRIGRADIHTISGAEEAKTSHEDAEPRMVELGSARGSVGVRVLSTTTSRVSTTAESTLQSSTASSGGHRAGNTHHDVSVPVPRSCAEDWSVAACRRCGCQECRGCPRLRSQEDRLGGGPPSESDYMTAIALPLVRHR